MMHKKIHLQNAVSTLKYNSLAAIGYAYGTEQIKQEILDELKRNVEEYNEIISNIFSDEKIWNTFVMNGYRLDISRIYELPVSIDQIKKIGRKNYEVPYKILDGVIYDSEYVKPYKLVNENGVEILSLNPGTLGGHKKLKIYGRLDCPSALRHIEKGNYIKHRVFFKDEETAIKAGYRPCARCMPKEYKEWKLKIRLKEDSNV